MTTSTPIINAHQWVSFHFVFDTTRDCDATVKGHETAACYIIQTQCGVVYHDLIYSDRSLIGQPQIGLHLMCACV